MIKQLIVFYLLQIGLTVGTIFLFGWLISICNRIFYKNLGTNSMAVCYATGFIGTPVHELSHALFCVIFGHKITEIKLFQVNSADGVLGYVQHSYNPKNIYHKIGNFFIGIAPIVVISSILFVIAKLLTPDMINMICAQTEILSATLSFESVLHFLVGTLKAVFESATKINWWIFVLIGAFLSLHMTLSKADMQGALSGLLFVLLSILIVDVILAVISVNAFASFSLGFLSVAGVLNSMLFLSLIVSVIVTVISFIIRFTVRKIFKR